MTKRELDGLVAQALADGEEVRGPALTPFLLERLSHLSGGRTTRVNRALAVANAAAGARVAKAYAEIVRD